MPLSSEQQQAAKEWYDLHLKGCPVCDCKEYVNEAVFGMPEIGPAGPEMDKGFSVVPFVCKSCGYTVLVSATALKFVKPLRPTQRTDP